MAPPPLELYILTFNCGRSIVDPSLLGPHVFRALPRDKPLPDLVQFSLQEVAPIAHSFLGGAHLTPYFDQLIASLNIAAKHRPEGVAKYRLVIKRNVGMTALMLFAKEASAERIKWLQTAGTGVGVMEMGNKGAVGVRLGWHMNGTQDRGEELEVTLIAAHLAPAEDAVVRRNEDWDNIARRLVFANEDDAQEGTIQRRGRSSGGTEDERQPLLDSERPRGRAVSPTPLYSTRGHVFVAGDLNYRTSSVGPSEDAYKAFPQPNHSPGQPQHFSTLFKSDQLTQELEAGRTLKGFSELPVTFPPTYKYEQPTELTDESNASIQSWQGGREPDSWDWAKHRFPSWCDRILYLSSEQLKPHVYAALPLLPSSDHRPVALSVSIAARVPHFAEDDARRHPPVSPDPEWRRRRASARTRELAVGLGAYLTKTNEGKFWLVSVLGGIAGAAYLLWRFLLS